ncbi:MAG: hypothetical protein QOG13_1307 [Sphingomonadales bacterium]|jgi:hypothetical protein|nr:hypothetical protein [Sphingomonadales bacterium]MEA3043458.1 hypothetical protein [Sphingomonadales bacterium]
MKRIAILLGCALAVAACTSQEDQLENAMRAELTKRGNVQEVEMTRQDENRMTGHAVVRTAAGETGRLTCNATRDPTKGTAYYDWRCVPAIDEALLTQTENAIRQSLAQRGEVIEVDMRRQDDDHMTGFARARDSDGAEVRLPCSASRGSDAVGNFSWRCGEGADSGAPAEEAGK